MTFALAELPVGGTRQITLRRSPVLVLRTAESLQRVFADLHPPGLHRRMAGRAPRNSTVPVMMAASTSLARCWQVRRRCRWSRLRCRSKANTVIVGEAKGPCEAEHDASRALAIAAGRALLRCFAADPATCRHCRNTPRRPASRAPPATSAPPAAALADPRRPGLGRRWQARHRCRAGRSPGSCWVCG